MSETFEEVFENIPMPSTDIAARALYIINKRIAECVFDHQQKEIDKLKADNEKLVDVLKKIAKYNTCHACEHLFGSGASCYCKSEKEHWGCRYNDWSHFEPVSKDKQLARQCLREIENE